MDVIIMATLESAQKLISEVSAIDDMNYGLYGAYETVNEKVMLRYGIDGNTGLEEGEEDITKWSYKELKAFINHEWDGPFWN